MTDKVDSEQYCDAIEAAADRVAGHAHTTPVMTSRTLDQQTGATVLLKCENLQRAGAFKFRGAYNSLSRLDETQRKRGVVTYSSGNHAQALACAGRELGIEVTVVMPDNAPAVKRRATEGYGGQVVSYDPLTQSREALGIKLMQQRGLTLIPPFDYFDVIAGQGTVALELLRQQAKPDVILVPTGGGGLLSGTALICARHAPECRVIGVEPKLADDATRSFQSGTLQTVQNPQTIADGTRTPSLGKLTFPIIRKHVADMVTVNEEAIADAVVFLLQRCKILVEPSGALGVAALLSGAFTSDRRVAVILSGGNIDPAMLASLLQPAVTKT